MAQNSLFAILLRSPWWASLGLAVGLALLMRLLLPEQYAVAGMLGSFPFVVIAAMAAWKQLRAPSAAQVSQTLRAAAGDELARVRRRARGRLPRPGPRGAAPATLPGADLELTLGHKRTVVGFRRWKAATRRRRAAARAARRAAARWRPTPACTWPPARVSDKASDFARESRVQLMGLAELAQLLRGRADEAEPYSIAAMEQPTTRSPWSPAPRAASAWPRRSGSWRRATRWRCSTSTAPTLDAAAAALAPARAGAGAACRRARPGAGGAGRGRRRGPLRPAGCAGQQRRHRGLQAAARHRLRRMARTCWPPTWTAPSCARRPPRR